MANPLMKINLRRRSIFAYLEGVKKRRKVKSIIRTQLGKKSD
jgi:hypothetical protein